MFNRGSSTQGDLNGFLDAGSRMQGELHFEDTFRVDGKITGKVVSDGNLIVGEHGEVDGEIDVARVYISGTVRGTLRARQRVEVTATGRILADIFAPSLVLEEGAFFEGRCSMQKASAEGSAKASGRENVTQMPVAKT